MERNAPGICCLATSPGWNDLQLTKNCGIVPFLFHKLFGFRAVMAGGRNGEYPSLTRYLPGVVMEFIENPDGPDVVRYIETRAADIDLLVLHGPQEYYYAAPLTRYRQLRPDGKVYLELDPNGAWMDQLPWNTPGFRAFLEKTDVVGTSCRKMQRYLAAKWPCRVEYLPNGFHDFSGTDRPVDFSGKEDVILTVGRIGTLEKRNSLLLETFASIADELPGWRVRFVGPATPDFQALAAKLLAARPDLKDRIELPGPVYDKKALLQEYRRAKVFCLTSFKEGGTPNVVAEALFGGCYMITSAIDGAEDIVDEGRCGDVFPIDDGAALADTLRRACGNKARLLRGGQRARQYGSENFDFTKIVRRLYYLLYGEGGAK